MSAADWLDLIQVFRASLITAAALGIAGSIAGFFVLLRGEALMALALPQVVAIGAALTLRWELEGVAGLLAPLGVAISALTYFVLVKRRGMGSWVLPCMYVGGLSFSFLLIANKGQEVSKLQTLFTGIEVAVTDERAAIAAPILVLVGIFCAMLWRRWLLIAQAPAAAELAGVRPQRWDGLFVLLLTIVTLLGTDSLGIVMVLAMLFLPAAAVLPWVGRIPAALVASAVLSLIFLGGGFYLSNVMNWPLSQSVGGLGVCVVLASHMLGGLRRGGH
jgi:ABC-type Mn2+/Zn2+ transport system permease subunit